MTLAFAFELKNIPVNVENGTVISVDPLLCKLATSLNPAYEFRSLIQKYPEEALREYQELVSEGMLHAPDRHVLPGQ